MSRFFMSQKQTSRKSVKVGIPAFVGLSKTSREKMPKFCREVGEVLLSVFKSFYKVFVFACFLFYIHNYFITLQELSHILLYVMVVYFPNQNVQ